MNIIKMNDLKKAIEAFISTLASNGVRGDFRSSSASWPFEIPTSLEIQFFYENFEPFNTKIESGMSPLRFFDIANLVKAQIGYRLNGKTGEKITSWPHGYLVIADDFGGGKPIIAVVDRENTPIFASYDVKIPFQIADSMTQFFVALTALINIVYERYEIFEIYDDDGELMQRFVQDVSEVLLPVLGQENYSRFFDYFYG